jgi:hypothetical protein
MGFGVVGELTQEGLAGFGSDFGAGAGVEALEEELEELSEPAEGFRL